MEKKNNKKERLKNGIQAVQNSIAGFLNEHFNKLSKSAQKMSLLLFGLAVGSLCILLITQSPWGGHDRTILPVNEITVPEKMRIPDKLTPGVEQEHRKLHQYKQWLDSLKTHRRSAYDSMLYHPGLPDSLDRLLERLIRRDLHQKPRLKTEHEKELNLQFNKSTTKQ